MSDSEIRVNVRKPDGTNEGRLEIYTQLDAIKKDMDVGSWSIQCPTTDISEVLGSPGYGIQIKIDDDEFLAGPTSTIEDDFSIGGATQIISGLSDETRLWEYLCYPSPPPFTSDDYDDQNDVAEVVMKHYVTYNLLDDTRKPAAVAQIRIAPNLGRGLVVPVSARFETVGDKLVSIATTGGNLGFGIKNLTFDVFERADRSADQVFSKESGNLLQFQSKRTRPTANRIICGGSGDGMARVIEIGSDDVSAATWGAYIESFRDRRDTSDTTQLAQSIAEEIAKGAEKNTLTLRTIDLPNRRYGTDWNLGDTVTAQGIVGAVKQVQLTVNDKGRVIVPQVNSASSVAAASILRAYDELRAVRRRISYLERTV